MCGCVHVCAPELVSARVRAGFGTDSVYLYSFQVLACLFGLLKSNLTLTVLNINLLNDNGMYRTWDVNMDGLLLAWHFSMNCVFSLWGVFSAGNLFCRRVGLGQSPEPPEAELPGGCC